MCRGMSIYSLRHSGPIVYLTTLRKLIVCSLKLFVHDHTFAIHDATNKAHLYEIKLFATRNVLPWVSRYLDKEKA